MKLISAELADIIDRYLTKLYDIPESEYSFKPSPAKWSKKEIMGHLIDSAESNIRRFVVAQYEDTPAIVYNQDKWVSVVNYQQWETKDIIQLWYLLNKQVCQILNNTTTEMAERQCKTQELHTLKWLAQDYKKHLLHHLHVVLNLEPVDYS